MTVVEQAIENFINKKELDKNGEIICAVAEPDRAFMHDFLPRYYNTYKLFFKDESIAEEKFCSNLSQLIAIRFDSVDENVESLKEHFENMRKTNNGKLEGGSCWVGSEGAVILDLDMVAKSKEEATHTAIHELTHLMSLIFIMSKNKKLMRHICCLINFFLITLILALLVHQ